MHVCVYLSHHHMELMLWQNLTLLAQALYALAMPSDPLVTSHQNL